MNQHQELALGFLTMAESYRKSAHYLTRSVDENLLTLRTSAPIDQLYAHSLELSLKAGLLLAGCETSQLRSYEHNILKMYDSLAEGTEAGLIRTAERNTRAKWRSFLREARDTYRLKFTDLGLDPNSDLSEFGVYDNATIGGEIPIPRDQIIWLSKRHAYNGSLFRYHETRLDSRQQISAFGLSTDVVRLSSSFLGEELETLIRRCLK